MQYISGCVALQITVLTSVITRGFVTKGGKRGQVACGDETIQMPTSPLQLLY